MKNNNSVFVSGATGFIGRRLCEVLLEKGYTVHALCRDPENPHRVRHEHIRYFKGNILDVDSIGRAMEGCSAAYHTAALARMWSRDNDEFYKTNVIGTRNVLFSALQHRLTRIVHTSSCGVLGPTVKFPMTEQDPRIIGFPIHYERTKHLAELEVRNFLLRGLEVITVNPSRVFGPGAASESNTVGRIVKSYLRGLWRLIPGDGDRVANYAYLEDVVDGHILAMEKGRSGERYILGGEDLSFNEFFSLLSQHSDCERKMYRIPLGMIRFYSQLQHIKTSVFGLRPVILPEFAARLDYDQKYSSEKATSELGYRITPFDQGLKETINYIRERL